MKKIIGNYKKKIIKNYDKAQSLHSNEYTMMHHKERKTINFIYQLNIG